ncbi:hypothetical protein COCC4DRAFT_204018, partial [Bipolaris maydis ATCC 48331]
NFTFLAHTAIGSQAARKPVRSFIFKLDTGGLVVRWVTTGESPLSYVFAIFFFLHRSAGHVAPSWQ